MRGADGVSSRRGVEAVRGRAGGGLLRPRPFRMMLVAVLRLSVQGGGLGPSGAHSPSNPSVDTFVVVVLVLVCVLFFFVWWWSSVPVALCGLCFGALSLCCPLPLCLERIFGFFFPAELLLLTLATSNQFPPEDPQTDDHLLVAAKTSTSILFLLLTAKGALSGPRYKTAPSVSWIADKRLGRFLKSIAFE